MNAFLDSYQSYVNRESFPAWKVISSAPNTQFQKLHLIDTWNFCIP